MPVNAIAAITPTGGGGYPSPGAGRRGPFSATTGPLVGFYEAPWPFLRRWRWALTAQVLEQYMRLVVPSNSLPHTRQLPLTLRLRAAISLATRRIASRKCSRRSSGHTIPSLR